MQTPEPEESRLNAAVQRCCEAYHRVLAIPRPQDGKGSAKDFASEAFRHAMPFLTSAINIEAFIACVAHGMLLGAIYPDDASKLLYAAQVAIGSRRARLQAERQAAKPCPQAQQAPGLPTAVPLTPQEPKVAAGSIPSAAASPEPLKNTPTPLPTAAAQEPAPIAIPPPAPAPAAS